MANNKPISEDFEHVNLSKLERFYIYHALKSDTKNIITLSNLPGKTSEEIRAFISISKTLRGIMEKVRYDDMQMEPIENG